MKQKSESFAICYTREPLHNRGGKRGEYSVREILI